MNSKRIAELRELCEKVMDGPWDNIELWNDYQDRNNPTPLLHLKSPYGFARNEELQFIAEARTALPEALDEIERLQKIVNVTEYSENQIHAEVVRLREAVDLAVGAMHLIGPHILNLPQKDSYELHVKFHEALAKLKELSENK